MVVTLYYCCHLYLDFVEPITSFIDDVMYGISYGCHHSFHWLQPVSLLLLLLLLLLLVLPPVLPLPLLVLVLLQKSPSIHVLHQPIRTDFIPSPLSSLLSPPTMACNNDDDGGDDDDDDDDNDNDDDDGGGGGGRYVI